MEVVSFKELVEKSETDAFMAFFEKLAPKKAAEECKFDPHMNDSPIGFCGLDGKAIVGFVGVLDLKTKTVDGTVEPAGGIYAFTHCQAAIG